jgi:hypothetical protein
VKLRRTVPAAVRAVPERRLAWGVTDDGTALVAAPTSLYVGEQPLPWTSVERVSWQPPVLTITEVAEVEGTGASHSWTLVEEARLAEIVRERVTASIAWSDVRSLQPAGAVRLVGRRMPGQEVLEWQTVWQAGTNPADPLLRAQVDAFLDGLRKSIG